MWPSPAHPIAAPLDDLMTGHTSSHGDLVAAWDVDVIDASSKGLLPQLIDVIHTLTEGQDALTRKVRDAWIEFSYRSASYGESQLQAEPSDSVFAESLPGPVVELIPDAGAVTRAPLGRANESSGTEWLNSAANGELTVAPGNRDYNFFDELDARLADLHDAADQPGNG